MKKRAIRSRKVLMEQLDPTAKEGLSEEACEWIARSLMEVLQELARELDLNKFLASDVGKRATLIALRAHIGQHVWEKDQRIEVLRDVMPLWEMLQKDVTVDEIADLIKRFKSGDADLPF